MQKIVTNLWFDTQAEEAARFYVSLIENSRMGAITYYGESGAAVSGQPLDSVLTVAFQLDGQDFIAFNGGPQFPFTHAISLMVNCETQEEIDRLWDALSEGGEKEPCGWLKDRYGVSWQVVPTVLDEMMRDADEARRERVMAAMLQMTKLDIAGLQAAYEQPVGYLRPSVYPPKF